MVVSDLIESDVHPPKRVITHRGRTTAPLLSRKKITMLMGYGLGRVVMALSWWKGYQESDSPLFHKAGCLVMTVAI